MPNIEAKRKYVASRLTRLVKTDALERQLPGAVLRARAHRGHQLEPVREVRQVPGQEGAQRVAVVGPVKLGSAQAVDHEQAGLERDNSELEGVTIHSIKTIANRYTIPAGKGRLD